MFLDRQFRSFDLFVQVKGAKEQELPTSIHVADEVRR